MLDSIDNTYENFIALSRYARWVESEGRRETWGESVDRYVDFMVAHVQKTNNIKIERSLVEEIRAMIFDRQVMPSMRALMTAGPALARDHIAAYNCSFIPVDNIRAFDEAMYILMCGTGVGFSVENKYVSKLPVVAEHFEDSNTVISVGDSKSGWARAFKELITLLYQGQVPKWDTSDVRKAGEPLKTFGGRASGPEPLEALFQFTVDLFRGAAGRQLTTAEAHDIMCKIGEVVVVGGVRRSAMISGSDLDDFEMAKAKSGKWWTNQPQRRLANNSAVYKSKPHVAHFLQEWSNLILSESGERGIFNLEGSQRHASSNGRRDGKKVAFTNPCGEILLRANEFCNLTEVVIKPDDGIDSLKRKVELATILGTWQSTLTDFKYIRKIWKDNCEEERLLGVSLTGQFGNRLMSGQHGEEKLIHALKTLRNLAISTNSEWAGLLGINSSVAITTVKPSGTVSQLTGVSSGMHPWHAEHYIRTIRADNKDPMTLFLKDVGVYWEADVMAPENTTIFYFPQKAPEKAITKSDLTALDHLNIWKVYKQNWTEHNPSITVSVRDHEWPAVAAWVYENWDQVGGISFLPFSDHVYQQAPYIEITADEYAEWVEKSPKTIDWSAFPYYEQGDTITSTQDLSCVAGECDIIEVGQVQQLVSV